MKHTRRKFNVGYSGMPDSDKAYREHFDRIFKAKQAEEEAKPCDESGAQPEE